MDVQQLLSNDTFVKVMIAALGVLGGFILARKVEWIKLDTKDKFEKRERKKREALERENPRKAIVIVPDEDRPMYISWWKVSPFWLKVDAEDHAYIVTRESKVLQRWASVILPDGTANNYMRRMGADDLEEARSKKVWLVFKGNASGLTFQQFQEPTDEEWHFFEHGEPEIVKRAQLPGSPPTAPKALSQNV